MHKREELYFGLLKDWCDALISLQLSDTQRKELKGGMVCPACGRIHGRTAAYGDNARAEPGKGCGS